MAATVVGPDSLPLAGFVAIATVTVSVKLGTAFPAASRAVTCTSGAIAVPADTEVGCTVNSSWVAAEGTMSKGALVAPVRPSAAAESVYPLPSLLMMREANVATPATAANVLGPDRVPPAGLVAIATVTLRAKPVAVLPHASSAVTRTTGLIVPPAVAVPGCTVNTSRVADPGVIPKAALVVPARPLAVAESV